MFFFFFFFFFFSSPTNNTRKNERNPEREYSPTQDRDKVGDKLRKRYLREMERMKDRKEAVDRN